MVFDIFQLQPFLQLLLAALLGGLIGLEREYKRKEAGLKTFSLVALGACFFTSIAVYLSSHQSPLPSHLQIDPARVIQAVAIGIGFIGSGLIIQKRAQVEGLTTAAALWAAAAIGIGIGVRLYFLAILGTFLTIGILAGFRLIEEKIIHKTSEAEYER
jgi:putative Mg2+ transporter-C (MgtC) family protein